jgi:hypothetical protein
MIRGWRDGFIAVFKRQSIPTRHRLIRVLIGYPKQVEIRPPLDGLSGQFCADEFVEIQNGVVNFTLYPH